MTNPRRLLRVAAGATLAVILIVGQQVAVQAGELQPGSPGSNCIYDVVGVEADGITMILEDTPDCYNSYAALLKSRGANVPSSLRAGQASKQTMMLLSIIATHYNLDAGTSLSIEGTTCGGGGLNMPAAWKNVIDRTDSPCHVAHYDNDNYTGFLESTNPPADVLAAGNQNRTNSALYNP